MEEIPVEKDDIGHRCILALLLLGELARVQAAHGPTHALDLFEHEVLVF